MSGIKKNDSICRFRFDFKKTTWLQFSSVQDIGRNLFILSRKLHSVVRNAHKMCAPQRNKDFPIAKIAVTCRMWFAVFGFNLRKSTWHHKTIIQVEFFICFKSSSPVFYCLDDKIEIISNHVIFLGSNLVFLVCRLPCAILYIAQRIHTMCTYTA